MIFMNLEDRIKKYIERLNETTENICDSTVVHAFESVIDDLETILYENKRGKKGENIERD